MKKLMIAALAALALGGLMLSGCSTMNTVEREQSQAKKSMVNDKRVITDSDLEDYAYIAGINQSKVDGLLKIQAAIVNSSTAYRSVNYKFTWFNKDAMELPEGATSSWQTLNLEGGEQKSISAVAPSPDAVDFTLKLLPNLR